VQKPYVPYCDFEAEKHGLADSKILKVSRKEREKIKRE
jgi:hypothetical protein